MAALSMVWAQVTGLPTGGLAKPASHPPQGTHCASGFAFGKSLSTKRFFQLSTGDIHRYLLLLSVYIKKKVNPSIDVRRSYQRRANQSQSKTQCVDPSVMAPPRKAGTMRVYGTCVACAVTKLTCRRQAHAGIMSPLEPPPGGSDVCFIYS